MNDDDGNRTLVPHCHTNDNHKKLGVILSHDENNDQQVIRIKKLSRNLVTKLEVDHNVLYGLHRIIVCTMNWPLPAITMIEVECTHIMALIITNVLSDTLIITYTIR